MDDDPSYDISIRQDVGRTPGRARLVRRAISAALARHHVCDATLSVAIVSDETIAAIHRTYLNHSGPTDVMTFDLRRDAGGPIDAELIISHDTATREAAARGLPVDAEIALYAVHGALHLCGYDDEDPDEAARMHAEEDAVLTGLGLGAAYAGGPR